jgi:hypothetical protein
MDMQSQRSLAISAAESGKHWVIIGNALVTHWSGAGSCLTFAVGGCGRAVAVDGQRFAAIGRRAGITNAILLANTGLDLFDVVTMNYFCTNLPPAGFRLEGANSGFLA